MRKILTAPQLLASVLGVSLDEGDELCYYCGAGCGVAYSTRDYVKPTFTARATVAVPSSEHVCIGCTMALDEACEMSGREKPQKRRNYSWLITATRAIGWTKADMLQIREACLAPPAPPYAFAIATSGQRQIIYMAPVSTDAMTASVLLEDRVIVYQPAALAVRLAMTERVVAACGKRGVLNSARMVLQGLAARYADWESIGESWLDIRDESLSALAIFIARPKEQCGADYGTTTVDAGVVAPDVGGDHQQRLFAS